MTKDPMTPAMALHANQLKRASALVQDTAKLAITLPGPDTFSEAAELGQATMERVSELQKSWAQDWSDWADYASALPEADTLPKYMEHAGNIFLRAQAQMVAQINDLSNLSENVSVSYGFWVAKQVEDKST